MIAALLGVPEADRERVRHDIDRCFHIEPGVGMINDISITAMAAVHGYIRGQLTDRSIRPRDDMLTDLVRAEITDDEGAVADSHWRRAPTSASCSSWPARRQWPA